MWRSTPESARPITVKTRACRRGELRQFAEARGWKLADEYVDHGVSGSKDSRPELNRLMADAKRRRFDVVLVWKLDRFGRSLRHLVNALAEFESLGIAFVSLSDNLDLSTASGRLMFHIIGAMAEFERALIQERVKAGIRNARAKGRRIGRPRACGRREDSGSARVRRCPGGRLHVNWASACVQHGACFLAVAKTCSHMRL